MFTTRPVQIVVALTFALGVSEIARAEKWECSLPGAEQKVFLTQQGKPEKTESGVVEGTVTDPYGKRHKALVRIRGFDRQWEYVVGDENYVISMHPSGQAKFFDLRGLKGGKSTTASHILYCEESIATNQRKEEELRQQPLTEKKQSRLDSQRQAYILAIAQKVERNWQRPAVSEKMPDCEVLVEQGPGGIVLDVRFGACKGSSATYRASIENAIYKAEPLPEPPDPALFNSTIELIFKPYE